MARGMRHTQQAIVISSRYLREEDEDITLGVGAVRGSHVSKGDTPLAPRHLAQVREATKRRR